MEKQREDWQEDLQQPHGDLDQPEEHANNADDQMELRVTVTSLTKNIDV